MQLVHVCMATFLLICNMVWIHYMLDIDKIKVVVLSAIWRPFIFQFNRRSCRPRSHRNPLHKNQFLFVLSYPI